MKTAHHQLTNGRRQARGHYERGPPPTHERQRKEGATLKVEGRSFYENLRVEARNFNEN